MSAAKKGFRSFKTPEEFVRAANEPPENPVAPVATAPAEPEREPTTPEAVEPVEPETTGEVGQAAESLSAVPSPAPDQPKPAPIRQKAAKPDVGYPWENAHPKVIETFNLRLPERTHLQLKWLAERSPDSMHMIALKGVEAEVARRLKELGIKM